MAADLSDAHTVPSYAPQKSVLSRSDRRHDWSDIASVGDHRHRVDLHVLAGEGCGVELSGSVGHGGCRVRQEVQVRVIGHRIHGVAYSADLDSISGPQLRGEQCPKSSNCLRAGRHAEGAGQVSREGGVAFERSIGEGRQIGWSRDIEHRQGMDGIDHGHPGAEDTSEDGVQCDIEIRTARHNTIIVGGVDKPLGRPGVGGAGVGHRERASHV